MSGGPSRGKGFATWKGKGGTTGNPIVWEGSLGPNVFGEPVEKFLEETKRDFNKERPLRAYDNRKEDWPKCMHGEDCIVQMYNEGSMEVVISSNAREHG
jgi:hypothetical protein